MFWSPGKTTEASIPSRYGATYSLSTGSHGADVLKSFLADFPVRTSQPQEQEQELTESVLGCGSIWRELSVRFCQDSFLWKTHLSLFDEVLDESSVTFPRWGMIVGGVLWERDIPARLTKGIDSGFLPTPIATDWKGGTTAIRKDRGNQRLDQWRDFVKVKYGMVYPHPTHSELLMGWPQEWTAPKKLETGKFQQWLDLHGIC
jgi:hypothetical protein